MKRLLVVLFVLAGAAAALPSWWGVRGLNRVVDARTIGASRYSVGLFTHLGISADERAAVLPDGEALVTDTEYDGTGYIVAGIGLGRAAEIGVRATYVVNQLKRSDDHQDLLDGEWEGDDGFSEAALALKYTLNPSSASAWFGIMPWAAFSIHDGGYSAYVVDGDGWDGIWVGEQGMFEMRRPMINSGSFSYGADLLATFDLKPVLLHANVGYHHFEQTFEFTDNIYGEGQEIVESEAVEMDVEDPVLYTAAGIEYPVGTTTLFAELEWRHFMDRNFKGDDDQDYDDIIQVAPGVRFNTDGLAIDVIGSFAISTFDPEWSDLGHSMYQAGLEPTLDDRAVYAPFPGGYAPQMGFGVGLSYTGDFSRAPALVGGRIYDAETGQDLDGTVTCSRSGVDPVAAAGGRYSIELPAGEAGLTAEAEGYLPASRNVQAAEGGTYAIDFALDRIDGNVIGTVTALETGEPLQGTVTMVGGPRAVTGDCQSNGVYQMSVPFGERTLRAQAEGFLPAERTVEVPGRGEITVDFQLRPALVQGQVLTFTNIYFDVNSANIKRESFEILDQVVVVLDENPDVRIQIAGHTDSDGAEAYNQTLSEQRAQSVYDYLVEHGISAGRLSTVGYGESQPVVPNTSAANKAQNRRIEFTVLGR